ncbi:hypothetical protein NPIL_562761 [Nephila pilipes]|uniref:Uncharacterized protein n=1 Tax=Nephila pilipes TaxID=299642 RepID=A0A8X6UQV5_NEPPI|nr:hypothetical protein NPIL_562761 [Nephila pilipes]
MSKYQPNFSNNIKTQDFSEQVHLCSFSCISALAFDKNLPCRFGCSYEIQLLGTGTHRRCSQRHFVIGRVKDKRKLVRKRIVLITSRQTNKIKDEILK